MSGLERQSCRRVIFDRVLGKGTFSTVYRALVEPDNQHIALKIVHLRDIVNDLKTVQDCVNEISNLKWISLQTRRKSGEQYYRDTMKRKYVIYLDKRIKCKKLNHSNIIRCLWWDFSDFELKIGLELATGGDLRRIIHEHYDKFSLIEETIIWSCAVQLSSALYHMHKSRIMHRDIKPANIFVYGLKEEKNSLYERWKGVKIKLGDFGFSKDIANGLDMTCRSVLGSPLYMSPERMLHQKYYFDSDIWSMACVIYELVALQAPFHLNTLDMNLMTKRIINGFYPPIPSDIYSIKITKFIDSCIIVDHKFRPNISQILRVTRRGLAESRNTSLSS